MQWVEGQLAQQWLLKRYVPAREQHNTHTQMHGSALAWRRWSADPIHPDGRSVTQVATP